MGKEAIIRQSLTKVKEIRNHFLSALYANMCPAVLQQLGLMDKKRRRLSPKLPYPLNPLDPPQLFYIKHTLSMLHHVEEELVALTQIVSKDKRKFLGVLQSVVPGVKLAWQLYTKMNGIREILEFMPQISQVIHPIREFILEEDLRPEAVILSLQRLLRSQPIRLFMDINTDEVTALLDNLSHDFNLEHYRVWLLQGLTRLISVIDRVEQNNGLKKGVLSNPIMEKMRAMHEKIRHRFPRQLKSLDDYVDARQRNEAALEAVVEHWKTTIHHRQKQIAARIFFKWATQHKDKSFAALAENASLKASLSSQYAVIQREIAVVNPGLDQLMVKLLNGEALSKHEKTIKLTHCANLKRSVLNHIEQTLNSTRFKFARTKEAISGSKIKLNREQIQAPTIPTRFKPIFSSAQSTLLSDSDLFNQESLERKRLKEAQQQISKAQNELFIGLRRGLHPLLLSELRFNRTALPKRPYHIKKNDFPQVVLLKSMFNAMYHAQRALSALGKSYQNKGILQQIRATYYSFVSRYHGLSVAKHVSEVQSQWMHLQHQRDGMVDLSALLPVSEGISALSTVAQQMGKVKKTLVGFSHRVTEKKLTLTSGIEIVHLLFQLSDGLKTVFSPNGSVVSNQEKIQQAIQRTQALFQQMSSGLNAREQAGISALDSFLGQLLTIFQQPTVDKKRVMTVCAQWSQHYAPQAVEAASLIELRCLLKPGLLTAPIQQMLSEVSQATGVVAPTVSIKTLKKSHLNTQQQVLERVQVSSESTKRFFKEIQQSTYLTLRQHPKIIGLRTYFHSFKPELERINPEFCQSLEQQLFTENTQQPTWHLSDFWEAEEELLSHYESQKKTIRLQIKITSQDLQLKPQMSGLSQAEIKERVDKMSPKMSDLKSRYGFWNKSLGKESALTRFTPKTSH